MTNRILIVDDSSMMRRQIRTILQHDPEIEVCAEAENGAEALQRIREHKPDLVVLDVLMPVMNGLQATREIKKLAPSVPVLLFTLCESPQLEFESKRAGADGVVPKSAAGTQLVPAIHSLLK
jgi:DNA-binding NarL/FixJ family response regulator